ncbi:ABC transporter permease [Clostridium botulinum]|uniref:ABC transporter permease n=1 Tax=Clostridium botulinum TaxID=1491 RepID=UPI00035BB0D2|nr:ABC transporter permease [Clostridium botulinum]AJD28076.1 branched-chain amino acid transport system / permease component family protein [Clostridium botulinum CDC_297]EPS53076.1 ABC transporter permease [Clostridium botulinum A1 str. CFSAN002368]MBY6892205.1 ABC transporter permease [Clostridium botulinum]MBY6895594.1 ABC transporter permease [Clostridium botulinum]MBY6902666.1 ABC transporter permease [Clostridium botulinum]
MDILLAVLEQGFIFSIVCFGVYITYKILDFPDLSVDGTFPLGAAVAAAFLVKGYSPVLSSLAALVAGAIAGGITGILHVKFKITNLLSGILVMVGLYSINLRIMGKSNIPLFNKIHLFSDTMNPIIIITVFLLICKITLDLFLKTKAGFILKATGDNEQLVLSLGVNKDLIKIMGLMLSNALVALGGALMAQYQGFSDVGMGTGIVVMGLASVIIGESLFGRIKALNAATRVLLGALVYKLAVSIALTVGLAPTDLKLVTAIIVVIALSLNKNPLKIITKQKTKEGGILNASNTKSAQSVQ